MIDLNDVLLAMSNIPVDDPIAEMWGAMLRGGYTPIIVEYTGALPITITANGNTLIDYRIYGASEGVGEPTENLFDKSSEQVRGYINDQGDITQGGNPILTYDYFSIIGGTEYTYISYDVQITYTYTIRVAWYDQNKTFISRTLVIDTADVARTVTAPSTAAYARLSIDVGLYDVLFTEGSTAPTDYIPYGYRLPMTVSVNYEYVFTGNESFSNSYGRYQFSLPKAAIKKSNASNTSCSHFPYGTGLSDSGTFSFEIGRFAYFGVRNEYPTITDFKQFLTDQYNAGTPMRLKYFLAPSDFPVYIGENQLDAIGEYKDYVDKASGKIVRCIKEYTFTGEEALPAAYGYAMRFMKPKFNDANSDSEKITCFSNFFNAIPNNTINHFNVSAPDGSIGFRRNDDEIVLKDSTKFTTAQECINYLKSQYDNGTPVKVWYVLETPIEEDPPVSFPDIPTIKGETIIDYDGDPKPSQMYIKYKGKG